MLPVLQIGPLAIQFPGLLLLAGVWLALLVVERSALRHGLPADRMTTMVLLALLAGIVGARLGYALRFLDLYFEQPLALFALNPNTLSAYEGLVAALLAGLVYIQRRELPLLRTLDVLAPGLALFMVAVGLAHLASGAAFGAPSTLPWSIELWGTLRQPSQVYESLAALLIFLLAWRLQARQVFDGFLFGAVVALQAAARLFLEAFRGDSLLVFGSLRLAQIVSLAVLLSALLALHLLGRRAAAGAGGGAGHSL